MMNEQAEGGMPYQQANDDYLNIARQNAAEHQAASSILNSPHPQRWPQ